MPIVETNKSVHYYYTRVYTLYTEIVQSDSLGYFYLTSISPGEYILKLKMMGMKLKNIPLTIDTLNINLGIIMMEEDDKILDEVIVTEKYPEKEIMFKDQNRSRFVTRWVPDDPHYLISRHFRMWMPRMENSETTSEHGNGNLQTVIRY